MPPPRPLVAAALGVGALGALAAFRPRGGGRRRVPGWAAAAWLSVLALAAATAGLGVGAARVEAIDGGALKLSGGERITVRGFVAAVPRRDERGVRVQLDTSDGRLLVEARSAPAELPVGRRVLARGVTREPADWERSYLARLGIATVLTTDALELTAGRRRGIAGGLDVVRDRAERALENGTTERGANLLRGFVLGQDDRIDQATRDEFKRSGLAHLLAVSGQNVVLLALLAVACLGALGVPRRARLAWCLALVAVYVPVAGAGPSIQRAGVMGAAAILAALASRPRSRWYAVLLAAAATLLLNPRASGDVGWQLSFAAVLGILLCAGGIRARLARSGTSSRWRLALAEGAALTLAATVATAPLMAFHFGTVSIAALPANLVALPAVAPVMWLGMLAAALGQLPWLPAELVTVPAGLLAGYIAQVAEWFAAPPAAQLDVALGGPAALVALYCALALAAWVALRFAARRRSLAAAPRSAMFVAALVLLVVAIAVTLVPRDGGSPGAPGGLRMTVLDVGQGDAILLEPDDGAPVLVDAGPGEADVAAQLASRGIDRLAALVLTHPQSDHVGGAPEVLDRLEVDRLLTAVPDRTAAASATISGMPAQRVRQGDVVRTGSLRLEVLWPPREAVDRQDDPNLLSLVALARWHGFRALLTGDAEAEAVPLDPGPVDVLKVAHHGSADAGLAELLARTGPRLAVVSVGESNHYGHPAPETLAALESAGVPVLRTDEQGEIALAVPSEPAAASARVRPSSGPG